MVVGRTSTERLRAAISTPHRRSFTISEGPARVVVQEVYPLGVPLGSSVGQVVHASSDPVDGVSGYETGIGWINDANGQPWQNCGDATSATWKMVQLLNRDS